LLRVLVEVLLLGAGAAGNAVFDFNTCTHCVMSWHYVFVRWRWYV
jgi:hypothetical protein